MEKGIQEPGTPRDAPRVSVFSTLLFEELRPTQMSDNKY